MTLSKKVFFSTTLFLIFAVLIVIFIFEIFLWESFYSVEDKNIENYVTHTLVNLKEEIRRKQSSIGDWGNWTDAQNFGKGEFKDFPEKNISQSNFISLELDDVVFLDSQDKIIYGKEYDYDKKELVTVPEAFLSEIYKNINFLKDKNIAGLINLEDQGIYLIAVHQLLSTTGGGPSSGTLIFSKKINAEFLKKLEDVLSLPFSIIPNKENNPEISSNILGKLKIEKYFADKSKSDFARVYTFFPDIYGGNSLILKMDIVRDIYQVGKASSLNITLSLFIFTILAIIIYIYLINNLVVKKISSLTKMVSGAEEGTFSLKEISLPGEDELSFLAEKFKNAITEAFNARSSFSDRNKELEKSQKAILNVLEDINTEKSKIEKLAGDLEKFKMAVDNASDGIIITSPDGIILYANSAVEKITGYFINEIIGKKSSIWGNLMPIDFYKVLWNTIKIEKKPFIGEITNKRKSGELYISETKISPVLNENKDVIFFVGLSKDITRLKEIDKAKTEFVSVASHQLRTPLTSIKWITEVLLKNRENNLNDRQKELMQDIYNSNDRIIGLVNNLLSISRIESGKGFDLDLKEVNIPNLIKNVVNEQVPIAEIKKVKIDMKINLPDDFKIKIDEEKIKESMDNFINNAVKYCKAEGGLVEVTAELKNDEFLFSVKDNGIGIPLKDQRRIFEKFYRADNARLLQTEGTGLGLMIIKAYIEKHGGKIWFESKENEGTTFTFTLKTNLI